MGETHCLRARSRSEAMTVEIARRLGLVLEPKTVVALRGDLGAGKTRFVQGIALGLGVPSSDRVSSPSFELVHEHLGGRLALYHVDLYRLPEGPPEPELGVEEYLYGEGVCAVEWADRMEAWLPPRRLDVELLVVGSRTREIRFDALGELHGRILSRLREQLVSR
ncbi:MAG: tRNA (adenosine(37)-N6)-threonylcarbamoyltransferase complex ATPase subunit type 1 TsaE [Thermodesulfobacteriota bacterium]